MLQSGEVYEASPLTFPGVMHIESTEDKPAVGLVGDAETWTIEATQIALTGIQLTDLSGNRTGNDNQPLVSCHSDVLAVRKCIFRTKQKSSCVQWRSRSGVTRVVTVEDSVFDSDRYGLRLTQATSRCEIRNSAFAVDAAAVRADIDRSRTDRFGMELTRVTQTGGFGFLDLMLKSQNSDGFRVDIRCGESVLAPQSALVRLASPAGTRADDVLAAFLLPERGNPTIVPPGVNPVIWFDRSLNQLVALPETQVQVDSVLIAAPQFRSEQHRYADDFGCFQLLDYEGPKLSRRLPGTDVSRLPTPATVATADSSLEARPEPDSGS